MKRKKNVFSSSQLIKYTIKSFFVRYAKEFYLLISSMYLCLRRISSIANKFNDNMHRHTVNIITSKC